MTVKKKNKQYGKIIGAAGHVNSKEIIVFRKLWGQVLLTRDRSVFHLARCRKARTFIYIINLWYSYDCYLIYSSSSSISALGLALKFLNHSIPLMSVLYCCLHFHVCLFLLDLCMSVFLMCFVTLFLFPQYCLLQYSLCCFLECDQDQVFVFCFLITLRKFLCSVIFRKTCTFVNFQSGYV